MASKKALASLPAGKFRLPPIQRALMLLLLLVVTLPSQQCYGFSGVDFKKLATRLPMRQQQPTVKKNNPSNLEHNPSSSSSSWFQFQTAESKINSPKFQLPPQLTNYYLLWSPKFLGKMILGLLSLWITLRYVVNTNTLLDSMPKTSSNVLFNGILPTLSSACCWIQLLLNMVTAAGCAGFNTYLGPLRPFFLSVLTYLTVTTRHSTPFTTILLRWTIALLPEMLHVWNTSYFQRKAWIQRIIAMLHGDSDSANTTPAMAALDGANSYSRISISLDIPSMGCVACINKIDSSLRNAISLSTENNTKNTNNQEQETRGASVHIEEARSWLLDGDQKGGKASVILLVPSKHASTQNNNTKEDVDPGIISSLVQSVENAGFPCKVDTIETYAMPREGADE